MKFYAEINSIGKIVPLYDSGYDSFKKVKRNTELQIEITQPRNIKFHRKFFSLINMVFDNQELFEDIEILRKELTILSGFYTEYTSFDGEVKREAQSISFASMDEIKFNELYSKFIDTVIKCFGYTSEDIEENLESYL
jgi:hypothetical protein